MKRGPFIVHINPRVRPRDNVDLYYPMMKIFEAHTDFAVAFLDAMNVWWLNLIKRNGAQ